MPRVQPAQGDLSTSGTPTNESNAETSAPRPTTGDTQVVKVKKYGVAFELPKAWVTIDAKAALPGHTRSPVLDELADRMGTTPERLAQTLSSSVLTLSVSDKGAQHGFLDNVNSVGQDEVLTDDAIKLQLVALGAKPGAFEHATSPAGDVTRVSYDLPTKAGFTVRAVVVAVTVEDATVFVTVSSSSAPGAAKIADQIQASLETIPGHDTGA